MRFLLLILLRCRTTLSMKYDMIYCGGTSSMIGAVNSKSQPVMLSDVQQREEEAGKRGRPQALGVLQATTVCEDSCALSSY